MQKTTRVYVTAAQLSRFLLTQSVSARTIYIVFAIIIIMIIFHLNFCVCIWNAWNRKSHRSFTDCIETQSLKSMQFYFLHALRQRNKKCNIYFVVVVVIAGIQSTVEPIAVVVNLQ